MSDSPALYVEVEKLMCRADGSPTPTARYFVSVVDSDYYVMFGVWDGPHCIDALQAAAEWGLPVFDMTEGSR